jgi:2-dehydro-3-deoxyphosphogluconate aldolase/(4S)-4-hydroxy-2-oxoglutarate aldolase
MSEDRQSILDRLVAGRLVAIIRTDSGEHLVDIARALAAGGIRCMEVTLTTPGALAGISRIARELGDSILVGVGTVLDARACRDAIDAGAEFVVSPGFEEAVHATTKEMGKVSIPGALTPTEILRAWTAGADLVKVFPSASFGPGYIRELRAPLPHVKLMPTGGIDVSNLCEWFKAGATCVGVGSALVTKDAVAQKDWPAITDKARSFIRAASAG